MLRAAMEQTIAGRGRVMIISGEPAIGKTRIAQAFTHSIIEAQVLSSLTRALIFTGTLDEAAKVNVYLAEVCAFLEDTERADTLYRFLLPYDGHNIVGGGSAACYGAAARFLGMLTTTMKLWEKAERHFVAALEMNAGQGARPWLAHSQYQYAVMLVARGHSGDREQAESLSQEALTVSREVGMRALEQRVTVLQAEHQSGRQRYPAGLSRREVDVLRLVAAGKANREIAKRLFVSDRQSHAQHSHHP